MATQLFAAAGSRSLLLRCVPSTPAPCYVPRARLAPPRPCAPMVAGTVSFYTSSARITSSPSFTALPSSPNMSNSPLRAPRLQPLRVGSRPPLHMLPVRHHMGHSHGHDIKEDLGNLTKEERERRSRVATRVTWIGLGANVALTVGKAIAGVVGNSSALIADAAHSWSDLLSDFITLWALKLARRPASRKYPYGYGKFEAVGALSVSAMLVLAGVGIGHHSYEAIILPDHPMPTSLALGAAVISIMVKEALYWITIRAGKDFNSKVMVANAWHHRSDALSSVVAVGGIVGAMNGLPWLDGAAGLAVSAMIVKVGMTTAYGSLQDLADVGVSGPIYDQVANEIRNTPEVLQMHELRLRRMGPYVSVDVHIVVDPMKTVSSAHQVAERVRVHVLSSFEEVTEVLVHVDPEEDFELEKAEVDELPEHHLMRPEAEIREDVETIVLAHTAVQRITHFRAHYLNYQVLVELEIDVDDEMSVKNAKSIGYRLQAAIVQGVSDVSQADIHLELHEPTLVATDDSATATS